MKSPDGWAEALRAAFRVTVGLPRTMLKLLREIDQVELGAKRLEFRAHTDELDETLRRIVEGLNR